MRIPAQNDQVAHMVRHFVGKNRQRRHGAQSGATDGGSSNQHAVAHAMHNIAQEYGQAAAAAVVAVGVAMAMCVRMATVKALAVLMAVVVEFGFAEQEENDQSNKQGDEELVRVEARLEAFGQQMQKRSAQKRTRRKAEQVVGAQVLDLLNQ